MDPFTMAMLGSTALSGISGLFGAKSAASAQSKAQDKAIAAQFAMMREAQQYQQQMVEQARAALEQYRQQQATARQSGLEGARGYQETALGSSNEAQLAQLGIGANALMPYMAVGANASNALLENSDYLNNPFTMDQAALEKTPGYQFALQQGLRAQQQSATTRGLGLSGAQMRGAADYATGLADLTYGQQFQREMDQRNALGNRLLGQAQTGQTSAGLFGTLNAAAGGDIANRIYGTGQTVGGQMYGTGNLLAGDYQQAANQIAQLYGTAGNTGANLLYGTGQGVAGSLTGQGNAQAAGILGGATALQSGASSLGNYFQLQNLLKQMGQYGGAGGGMYDVRGGTSGGAAP